MNMLIVFRGKESQNLFRDIIINSIELSVADKAYLCSGFFQEFFRDSYQATKERDFDKVLKQSKIELVTIGIHNNYWKNSYKNFVNNLKKEGVNVTSYITSNLRWHAKIFMLEKDKKNILGIIGSSNITRPAFSTNHYFNYECDVVIWDEEVRKLTEKIQMLIEEHDPIDLIKTRYEPRENSNIGIHDKLEYLKKQFMESNKLKEMIE